MRGVVDEIVMAGMRHDNLDECVLPADPVELLKHGEEDPGVSAKVLQAVIEEDFFHRIIRPGPRHGLEIHDQIGLAYRRDVDIDIALALVVAATHVQFHEASDPVRSCAT